MASCGVVKRLVFSAVCEGAAGEAGVLDAPESAGAGAGTGVGAGSGPGVDTGGVEIGAGAKLPDESYTIVSPCWLVIVPLAATVKGPCPLFSA